MSELAAKLGDLQSQFPVVIARYAATFVRPEDDVRDWRKNLDAMHQVAEKMGTIDQGRDRTLSLFVGAEIADRQLMDHSLELLTECSNKDNHRQLYWVQTHARAIVAILEGDFGRAESYANEAARLDAERWRTCGRCLRRADVYDPRRSKVDCKRSHRSSNG